MIIPNFKMRKTMKKAALPKKSSKPQKKAKSFGQQEVDFSKFLPLPEGHEKIFIALYLITIPYIFGLAFLFLFVAKGSLDSFMSMDIAMFLAVWAIGYEIVAAIALLVIFYKMFTFTQSAQQPSAPKQRKSTTLYEIHKLE